MRRSWLQVRLHFEMIDCAILGIPFPKVSSREVRIVAMELPILIIVHCDGVGNCDFKSLGYLVCVFFIEERATEQKPDDMFKYAVYAE